MCGIAGLFLKNDRLQGDLGRLTSLMLRELCDRGPDSAGFAVYGGGTPGITKICAVSRNGAVAWSAVARQLAQAIRADVDVEEIVDRLGPRPGAVVLPSWTVSYVAHAPGGAHPSYALGYSVRDNDYYVAWDAISRDRDVFTRGLDEHVYAVPAGQS